MKMKVLGAGSELPAIVFSKALNVAPDSDLLPNAGKPPRRKIRTHHPRLKRAATPTAGRSRPETPLLTWKFHDPPQDEGEDQDEGQPKSLPHCRRQLSRKGAEVTVSARRLAAGLWRLRSPPEAAPGSGGNGGDPLGFQSSVCHDPIPFIYHGNRKAYDFEAMELMQSAHSFSDPKYGLLCKLPNSAMEGATKWDPIQSKASDEVQRFCSQIKLFNQQARAVSVISALESDLGKAHARIQELETEERSSKKKLEHFMRKLSEERAAWRSREHEKIRVLIDDAKDELSRERKNRQRMELVNSKLVSELADVKFSAKRFMQDYEKERRARELIEKVCDELAKEIGDDKAEIEAIKLESMKLQEEVEDEKKMLQMAELWREERVQMKLIDAKMALDEKYTQMKKLVADIQDFMRLKSATADEKGIREAKFLLQAAASVNIQDIKEFSYTPPNPDDIFSVFEDVNFSEANERGVNTCAMHTPASHASKIHTVSPEINRVNRDSSLRHLNAFVEHNGDTDESGWETVSQVEDQCSSYSPEGSSDLSVPRFHRNRITLKSGKEWEENAGEQTPTEFCEVCPIQSRQLKKSSISKLWKSSPNNGENYKIISVDGMKGRQCRLSNESIVSSEPGSVKGELSPSDPVEHWSSPDSENQATKGRVEWPRSVQKNSLKTRLSEARHQTQKIQLRHALKQKI